MKATRSLPSLILLAALGSLAGAQNAAVQPAPKKQEPPKVQPKEASTAKVESGRELSFSVTGLTKDNLTKVKDSLQGLTTHAYTCEACKVEQASAGNCPKCQGALKAVMHPIFKQVQPSAEANTVALTIDPAATLRLSELDNALGKNSVKIDPAHFMLPGRSRLLIQGASADAAPVIEKALVDAKLFDEVKAKFDPATSELAVMVRAGASAPTRAKVAATIEGAKAKLADVVWGPMGVKS